MNQTSAPLPRHPCVLLAEDDADLRALLHGELELHGFAVVSMANGVDAATYLDLAFREPNIYATPDVIVSDVRMPQLDGRDLLAYGAIWHVPTILMTAFGSRELHCEAEKLGAVTCLDKPFDMRELCDLVRAKVA